MSPAAKAFAERVLNRQLGLATIEAPKGSVIFLGLATLRPGSTAVEVSLDKLVYKNRQIRYALIQFCAAFG